MKFGARMERELQPAWRDHYLSYNWLKERLRSLGGDQSRDARAPAEGSSEGGSLLHAEKLVFQALLDQELAKVLGFFKSKNEEISQQADTLRPIVLRILGRPISVQEEESPEQKRDTKGEPKAADRKDGNEPGKQEVEEVGRGLDERTRYTSIPLSPPSVSYPTVSAPTPTLSPNLADIDVALSRVVSLTNDVAALMQFISLNVMALRKILKKFARRLQGGLPEDEMGSEWILEVIVHPEQGDLLHTPSFLPAQAAHELHDMLTHTPLKTLAATLSQWDADLLALRKRVYTQTDPQKLPPSSSMTFSSRITPLSSSHLSYPVPSPPISAPAIVTQQPPPFHLLHGHDSFALDMSSANQHTANQSRPLQANQQDPFPRTQSFQQSATEHAVSRLRASQFRAEREARLIRARPTWYGPMAAVFEEPPTEELEAVLHKHKSRIMTGLIIVLLNSLLYMSNYFLIVPFVESFCQHLQVSGTWNGVVVGLADMAGLVLAFVYSFWTNHSFVWPIIVASVASVLGNVLYCVSYDASSLELLLVSRFLTGVGSARMVTRRFIADYMTGAQTTRASIAFVSSSALGMAIGPLLYEPLSSFPSFTFLGLSFNPLTMPGWLMAGAWLIQLTLTLMLFREPPIEEVRAVQAAEAEGSKGRKKNGGKNGSESSKSAEKHADGAVSSQHKPDGHGIDSGTHVHCDMRTPLLGQSAIGDGSSTNQSQQQQQCYYTFDPTPHDQLHQSERSDTGQSPHSTDGQSSNSKADQSPGVASSQSPHANPPSVKHTLPATAVCLLLLCVLKTVQQGHTDLVPAFTRPIGFDEGSAGLFLAGCGLAMLPVSLGVGMLATRVSDRALTLAATVLTVLCCGVLCRSATHHAVYLSVSVVIFLATAVLESAAMALISKIMHPSLAHGFFNAGLITTQAGSIGRLGGNLLVSEATRYAAGSTARLALALYSASGAVTALCLALLGATYRRMRA